MRAWNVSHMHAVDENIILTCSCISPAMPDNASNIWHLSAAPRRLALPGRRSPLVSPRHRLTDAQFRMSYRSASDCHREHFPLQIEMKIYLNFN